MVVIKRIIFHPALVLCLLLSWYSAVVQADTDISLSASEQPPANIKDIYSVQAAGSNGNASPASDDTAKLLLASAIGAEVFKPSRKTRPELTELPDTDDNLRLLEIHVGKYQLEDLLPAYQYRDIIFIPLGFFSELIDLAIKTDPASGIAQGFIFNENRRFYLDGVFF